jgi:glycosyltransferase involved in cell wall biosynthesis
MHRFRLIGCAVKARNETMSHRITSPDISLVVNTYMKPRHLGLVLDSIAVQVGVEGRFEVIVSDDGSTDETASLVADRAARADYRLAFTTRPHDGFRLARVRNDGARLARGSRLLFLDGDCILPRDHVAVHLDRCREGVATGGDCARLDENTSRSIEAISLDGATVPRLISPAERAALRRRLRKWRWHTFLRHPTKPRLIGNNICIHRRDFERVNGFDERFVGWGQEDDDISLRLRAAGVRLETVLDRTCSLHVWHPTDPSATVRWRDGANVAYFLRRGRLTACRQGLASRPLDRLRWRLPEDVQATASGRAIVAAVGEAGEPCLTVSPDEASLPEIDLVIRPGRGRFQKRRCSRPAIGPECRLLVVEGPAAVGRHLEREADVVLKINSPPRCQPPENGFCSALAEWTRSLLAAIEPIG